MPQLESKYSAGAAVGFWQRIKEVDMFFAGTDDVHDSLRRIVGRLDQAGIPYAVVGGMAVNAHNYHRTTKDVDLLLSAQGFTAFRQLFVSDLDPIQGRIRQFRDRVNQVKIDVLVTGMFPGSGKPGPIAYPDPASVSERMQNVSVVNLATLVEMKLAARRYRDFGDVVELIRFNNLDEAFADRLHLSVRGDYIECLEEMRRDDEYDERN